MAAVLPLPPYNASVFRIALESLAGGATSDAAYAATVAQWQPTIDFLNARGVGGNRTIEMLPVDVFIGALDPKYKLYPLLDQSPRIFDAVFVAPNILGARGDSAYGDLSRGWCLSRFQVLTAFRFFFHSARRLHSKRVRRAYHCVPGGQLPGVSSARL